MKTSAILATLAATTALAAPSVRQARQVPNLPGLNDVQSAHARAVIGETKRQNLGKQGCLAAITTGLVESNILVYANENVPESLNVPHDAVGSDHDSVGIFQQRVSVYKNVAGSMDPAQSAGLFFNEMKNVAGWETMDVGKLCQEVQRSAYPDRYAERVGEAVPICAAEGFP